MHVAPATHCVGPVYPDPPHCPYIATVPPELAGAVGLALVVAFSVVCFGVVGTAAGLEVLGVGFGVALAFVVVTGDAPAPLPPQVATGPPGAEKVDMSNLLYPVSTYADQLMRHAPRYPL